MIATWLAGKLSGVIIFCIACLSIPLAIFGTVEAVELHGVAIPFPIWGPIVLADGALGERDKAVAARDMALKDLSTAKANEAALTTGLNTCNTSVDNLHAAGVKATADAQAKTDEAATDAANLWSRIAALQTIKSTGEKCPVAQSIILGAFR